jgi:hypothetical protein
MGDVDESMPPDHTSAADYQFAGRYGSLNMMMLMKMVRPGGKSGPRIINPQVSLEQSCKTTTVLGAMSVKQRNKEHLRGPP